MPYFRAIASTYMDTVIKFTKISNKLVFWDVMTCSSVDRHQNFRETCCLHLQDTLKMETAASSKALTNK
jgi:hypothetical protein